MSKWITIQEQVKESIVQVIVSSRRFDYRRPFLKLPSVTGSGSGFFIPGGFIVTNQHVVECAEIIHIQNEKYGRKRFKTQVISICPDKDLALLKVIDADFDVSTIKPLELEDSFPLKKAQEVMIVGFPIGYEDPNFSIGNISGFNLSGRSAEIEYYQHNQSYIQLTAPINPGNSGGPVLNLEGKVIGVSAAGYLFFQGIGFAIPSKVLINIQSLLMEPKSPIIRTPYFGFEYNHISSTVYKNVPGILITYLYPDSPFLNILRRSDILQSISWQDLVGNEMIANFKHLGQAIVSKNGKKLNRHLTITDVQDLIRPGLEINCKIIRGKEKLNVKTFFVLNDSEKRIKRKHAGFQTIKYRIIAGMCISEIDYNQYTDEDELNIENIMKEDNSFKKRLMVTHIFDGSPLYDLQLFHQENIEILVSFQHKKVKTLDELDQQINLAKNDKKENHIHFQIRKNMIILDKEEVIKSDQEILKRLFNQNFNKNDFIVEEYSSIHTEINQEGGNQNESNDINNEEDTGEEDTSIVEDSGKEDSDKEDTSKEDTGKEDTGKEDSDKEDTDKEDTDKEDTGKEDTGKEDNDKDTGEQNTNKEDTGKEDSSKENTGKEDAGEENTNKEDTGNEESDTKNENSPSEELSHQTYEESNNSDNKVSENTQEKNMDSENRETKQEESDNELSSTDEENED